MNPDHEQTKRECSAAPSSSLCITNIHETSAALSSATTCVPAGRTRRTERTVILSLTVTTMTFVIDERELVHVNLAELYGHIILVRHIRCCQQAIALL